MPYVCTQCEKIEGKCKCLKPDYEFDSAPVEIPDDDFTIANEPEEVKKKAENPISILIKFIGKIVPEIIVAADDTTKIIARVPTKICVENYVMSSRKFHTFLKVKFHEESKIIFGDDNYKAAAEMASVIAVNKGAKLAQTYLRVAQLPHAIYYDLATQDKLAVKITANKVETIHLSINDPVFLSTARTAPQVRPSVAGTGLDELMKLLQISKEQQLLFKVNFISFLLEKFPVPIMGLVKEHGSGKTTLTGTIKKIIDPQSEEIEDNTTKLAAGSNDRMVQMSKSYLLGYDNISYIKPAESDDICRAVTGTSADKRSLFTNDDQYIITLMRKFVFNGIGFLSDRTDFNSRTIYYSLNEIGEIMPIEDYTIQLNKIRPAILADVFDVLSKAIVIQPQVKQELKGQLTRMADFCVWGESISRVLGSKDNEFMDNYKAILEESTIKAAESHALVGFIESEMEKIPKNSIEYEGGMNPTISKFYKAAKIWADENGYDTKGQYSTFPKGTNKVRGALQRIKPYLTQLNYHVEISERETSRSENRGERFVIITRLPTGQEPQEPQ